MELQIEKRTSASFLEAEGGKVIFLNLIQQTNTGIRIQVTWFKKIYEVL